VYYVLHLLDCCSVIEILEIFENKSVELKAALKKHLDVFSAYPSKWTTVSEPYYRIKMSGVVGLRSVDGHTRFLQSPFNQQPIA